MRVHGRLDFLRRGLQRARQPDFGDELRGAVPDDVGPEDLAVPRVGDQLHHPFLLSGADRAPVGPEGETTDLHGDPARSGALLGQPDRGHFRLAVDAVGNPERIHRAVSRAAHHLDGRHALRRGRVGEHRRADHITDGVQAGRGRAVAVVHRDEPVPDLGPRRIEPEIGDAGGAPHRHQDRRRLDRLHLVARAHRERHAVAPGHRRLHARRRQRGDPLPPEALREQARDLRVGPGQELIRNLDEGHAAPEGVVPVGELHADGPAADHGDCRRTVDRQDGLIAVEDRFAVEGETGEPSRFGAGREDHAITRDLDVAAVPLEPLDEDARGRREAGGALEGRDLVLLHQELDALRHPPGHLAAARHDLRVVD